MTVKELLRGGLDRARAITNMLLNDLTDEDLRKRPAPAANTAAWQLGHVVASEHQLVSTIRAGSMPELPAGFAEKYTKETASRDDAPTVSKSEYLRLLDEQRQGTLKVLDMLSDAELEAPCFERMRAFATNNAGLLQLVAEHEVMHLGQISVLRRVLGKPHAF